MSAWGEGCLLEVLLLEAIPLALLGSLRNRVGYLQSPTRQETRQ